MQFKLLALDLDGTLVRRDGSIHPDDAASIRTIQSRGIIVTIVTGRLYSGTRSIAKELNICAPVACVDGSHIVDPVTHREVVAERIVGEDAVHLRRVLEEKNNVASFLFAQDRIIHDERGLPFANYVRSWSPDIQTTEALYAHDYWNHEDGLHAVVSVGPTQDIDHAVKDMKERGSDRYFIASFPVTRLTGASAMVVRAPGTDKGTALAWLAHHHGIGLNQTVAVGDWINDQPMLKVAGHSFAMRQAPKHVQESASEVLQADGMKGGGVAEAIAKVWNIL